MQRHRLEQGFQIKTGNELLVMLNDQHIVCRDVIQSSFHGKAESMMIAKGQDMAAKEGVLAAAFCGFLAQSLDELMVALRFFDPRLHVLCSPRPKKASMGLFIAPC